MKSLSVRGPHLAGEGVSQSFKPSCDPLGERFRFMLDF
jgi:hypothetical protein